MDGNKANLAALANDPKMRPALTALHVVEL
jgi:hypothetical protein